MPPTERPRVFLHIGAPKTGTTYLQRKLEANQDALRRDGCLYPSHPAAHVWATRSLQRRGRGTASQNERGAWRRLVEELRAFGGPGIIDQELLSGLRPHHIERALRTLSWADVHVVYTIRDMARTLPAAWQERMKNGRRDSYAEFFEIVHLPPEERRRTGDRFWRLHDTRAILARWARDLPPANMHVITLPQSGGDPAALWRRFSTVLGLEADRYPDPPAGANTSVSAAAATVLRRINSELSEDFPDRVYVRTVKQYLAPELAARKGPPIALPPEEYEWAVAWSRDLVEFLRTSSYDIVGDLDELIPDPPRPGVDPDTVDAEQQLDVVVDAARLLMQRIAERHQRYPAAIARSQKAANRRGRAR
jgi:hypothetical protein